MTATDVRSAPGPGDAPITHRPGATTVIVLATTVLALALRLEPLRLGWSHVVRGYDDGVYLGSALDLVHGTAPYADAVIVQPPGLTLLLTPVAALAAVIGTGQAMALATLLTGVAGAASVPLLARLLRHRGPAVVGIACFAAAVQKDAVHAATNLLIEPWLVLAVLGGLAVCLDGDRFASGRRLLIGGLLLGAACSLKLWAAAPALAVLIAAAPDVRRLGRLAVGMVAGLIVTMLPFAVLAPGAFWRDVVTAQLARQAAQRTAADFRLVHVFGYARDGSAPPVGATVGAALVAVAIVAAWLVVRPRTSLDRVVAIGAVLVVGMLFVPPTFYWHYAAFAAPFLAAALAIPAGCLATTVGRAWSGAVAALLVVTTVLTAAGDVGAPRYPDVGRLLAAHVRAGACVVTTLPSAAIAADRFVPGCTGPLDPYGLVLAATGGRSPTPQTLRAPAVTSTWLRALHRADVVYRDNPYRDNGGSGTPLWPTAPAIGAYLRAHFVRVPVPGLPGTLYRRRGPL